MDTSRSSKGKLLQDIWNIVGISFVLIVILEFSLTQYYDSVDEKLEQREMARRAESGAYGDADWTGGYFEELAETIASLRWAPYTFLRIGPHQGRFINVDAAGIRRTWNAAENVETASPLNVFFFGGSTLWGYGARDDFTIASIVSKRLADHGLRAAVTNYAVPADTSSQSLIRLVFELRKGGKPDLVVFYNGLVDTFSACAQGRAGTPYGAHRVESWLAGQTPRRRLKLQLIDYTLHNLGLIRLATNVTNSPQNKKTQQGNGCPSNGRSMEALADESAAIYVDNVRFIQELSRTLSFQTLFYLEPQLADKTHRTALEELRLAESKMMFSGETDLYALTRDKLLTLQAGATPHVHDMRAIFSEHPGPIYIDSGHYGERGNELIADKIAADILAFYPL